MHVLVVGAGEMGRWLARVLRDDAPVSTTLSFTDVDPDAASAAADAVGGAVYDDETVDAVCIAVPMGVATDAIQTYASKADEAMLDVTGTMAEPVAAMADRAPNLERTSFHPLFAPANEPGNVAAVTDNGGRITAAVRTALTERGNEVHETTPAEHDRAMETVQARVHTAVLAYALAAEDVPDYLHTSISAPLADLVSEVTGGEARVYADIQAEFDGAADVVTAARRIAEADEGEFRQLYEEAGR